MIPDNLNTTNLIELNDQLNLFAKHHRNQARQDAIKLVQSLTIDFPVETQLGHNASSFKDGYDTAFSFILQELKRDLFHK